MILFIICLVVVIWAGLSLEYFLNREYGCIKWAALIFGLPGLLVSMFAAQIKQSREIEARLSKILTVLDPPIVACSVCKRAIPATPSFRRDGICPHCSEAHDPKSIAKAIKDS